MKKQIKTLIYALSFLALLLPPHSMQAAVSQGKYVTHITPTNASLVGRGNDQAIASITLQATEGFVIPPAQIKVDFKGSTNLKEIRRGKLYLSDNALRFDPRRVHLLVASASMHPDGQMVFTPATKLIAKDKKQLTLWLCVDIAPQATEGHVVQCHIKMGDQATTTQHTIALKRTLISTPGDYGAASYRIPGIVTCLDGTLVMCQDKRKNHSGDLPADIDVEVKRSTDGGTTWSAPITIAKGTANHGYGDAAIAVRGNHITMVMVGGAGLWQSTKEKPIRFYTTQSDDAGKTWSELTDITSQVYANGKWFGGFVGSGRGIVRADGTIVFVAAMRTDARWGGPVENVLLYSKDGGRTWLTSNAMRPNGDESKVVELNDGRLLVSSRNREATPNARAYALTADLGQTWTPLNYWQDMVGTNCNGSIIRYTHNDKDLKSYILLHSLPANKDRYDLTIFVSKDNGKTWPYRKNICKGEAAYSSMTVLPDGTIGIITEEDDQPAYDLWFTQVSLEWLMDEPTQ